MSDAFWKHGPPRIILLATDLSSRCDRALDRAAQLAVTWKSRLVVVHVLDPRDATNRMDIDDGHGRLKDQAELALRQVRRDLEGLLPALSAIPDVEIRIEEGNPAERIDALARTMGAGLIVTGIARDETLGRQFLGTTVQRLVRRTPIPVLIVKARARPYREILVATDFSPPSRHALDAAMAFFPQTPKTLFHAFEVPFPELLDRGTARQEYRELEQSAAKAFLAESGLTSEQMRNVRTVIEHGVATSSVRSYMQQNEVDIVVLATHGRTGLFRVALGGTAKLILEYAPGDVLLIREPRSLEA